MGLYDDVYKRFAKNFSVYDGDSIKADMDEGDHRWEIQRPLRLYGIDTPELSPRWALYENEDGSRDEEGRVAERSAALEARGRLQEFLDAATNIIVVQTVKVPGKPVRDKYGRTLGRIFVPVGEVMIDVNHQLLAEGHAREYFGKRKDRWKALRPLGKVDPSPQEVARGLK